ncbi:MAG: cation:dicarboxylase symporter family transporter [Candidatus Paracaedimonas acanthamoebae]|uniref:Cation:dicarboxylase symporter family transporter n=1 Tax=Candidatus Paracaedimonas acanthamoebae TaxID=244581 RepID=A0A8J7Q0A3_9PROT|nr:cation:dicarboxylase symporter family transporter [Candidatus Paracaedimonas acanthamoebae]
MRYSSFATKILTNPLTVLGAIIFGTIIGLYDKQLADMIAPIGKIYLSALQMSVVPLIIVMITCSIARFMHSKGLKTSVSYILFIFSIGLIISTFLGGLCATIFGPGSHIDETMLANIMKDAASSMIREVDLNTPIEANAFQNLNQFISELLPKNFFSALAEGKILQIVIFTIILGTAIGSLNAPSQKSLLNLFESTQKALQKILSWLSIVLPFGVLGLMADQISKVDLSLLLIMTNFICSLTFAFFSLIFLSSLIIWANFKGSYLESIRVMYTTIVVALTTRNSFLAMSEATDAFTAKLKFDSLTTNLLLPLGITICRYGNVLYFSFTAVFIAQIYNVPLTFSTYYVIFFGSIIAGIATSGATGVASIALISIVLEPLGLPLGAVFVLLITVDVIADPLRTLAIIYPNCAATSYIAKKENSFPQKLTI